MKLTCCECGKKYEIEVSPTLKNIEPFDFPGKNLVGITKCPYCGLRHWLFLIKVAEKWTEEL